MFDNLFKDMPVDPIVIKIGIPLAIVVSLFFLKKLFKKILVLLILASLVAGYFFFTADNPSKKIQSLLQSDSNGLSEVLDDKLNMSAGVNGLPDADAIEDFLGDEAGKSFNARPLKRS